VIDEDKNNLWSFSRRAALEMAEQRWLDLIQMHYDPVKQVCTAILADYWKYMYRRQKDNKEKKKNQKQRVMKELKISYSIWDNDLALKIKKWREFLEEWNNVRFVVRLRWREKIYEDKAVERLKWVVAALEDAWRTQFPEPKKEVQWYSIVLFSKV
jgi:translation initiation factor IF-3